MTARRIIYILAALAFLAATPACEQQTIPKRTDNDNSTVVYLGDPCDWQSPDSCGPGFQCDRITDEGEYLEDGICLLAQGASCPDPSAQGLVSEFCGRALSCQAAARAEDVFICLPNTCVDDSECISGSRCRNNTCIAFDGNSC